MSQLYGDLYQFQVIYASTAALAADTTITAIEGARAAVTGNGVYQYYKQAKSGDVLSASGGYWTITTDPYLLMDIHHVIDSSQVQYALFANGSVSAPSIAFKNEPGLGIYRSSTHDLAFANNNLTVMEVIAPVDGSPYPNVKFNYPCKFGGLQAETSNTSWNVIFSTFVNYHTGSFSASPAPLQTIPSAASMANQILFLKNNAGFGASQVQTTDGSLIDGAAFFYLGLLGGGSSRSCCMLYSTGSEWIILNIYGPHTGP